MRQTVLCAIAKGVEAAKLTRQQRKLEIRGTGGHLNKKQLGACNANSIADLKEGPFGQLR